MSDVAAAASCWSSIIKLTFLGEVWHLEFLLLSKKKLQEKAQDLLSLSLKPASCESNLNEPTPLLD